MLFYFLCWKIQTNHINNNSTLKVTAFVPLQQIEIHLYINIIIYAMYCKSILQTH